MAPGQPATRLGAQSPAPGTAVEKGLGYPPYDPVNLRARCPLPPLPGPIAARLSAVTALLAQLAFLALLLWGVGGLGMLLIRAGTWLVERLPG